MATLKGLLAARSAVLTCIRRSGYLGSKLVEPSHAYTDVEVSTAEWKFVERLLPPKRVPEPLPREIYPSGWIPQRPELHKLLPYFVKRSVNHQTPVYLKPSRRGMRRLTLIRHIQGDIWCLHDELRAHLEKLMPNTPIGLRVNELHCKITVKGDYVTIIKDFLHERGL